MLWLEWLFGFYLGREFKKKQDLPVIADLKQVIDKTHPCNM